MLHCKVFFLVAVSLTVLACSRTETPAALAGATMTT